MPSVNGDDNDKFISNSESLGLGSKNAFVKSAS